MRCGGGEPEPISAICCFSPVMTSSNDHPPKPLSISPAQLFDGAPAVAPGDPANDEIRVLLDAGATERARALREKAEEIRETAERMTDEEARRSLARVADQYELLAGSVDRRPERASAAADDD